MRRTDSRISSAARGSSHRCLSVCSFVLAASSKPRVDQRRERNQTISPTGRIYLSRMCCVDLDLDDGGPAEEEKGEEEEEFWMGDAVKMLPPPMAHSEGSAWGSRRGRCGCAACGAALVLWNLCVLTAGVLLLAVVFSVVLMPAVLLLYAGFLCHSRVLNAPSAICRYLDDNSSSALIILGFVMMSPLVVVAAAVFCGLLRRFRLLLFIQPIRRAWYRGRLLDWGGSFHVWV